MPSQSPAPPPDGSCMQIRVPQRSRATTESSIAIKQQLSVTSHRRCSGVSLVSRSSLSAVSSAPAGLATLPIGRHSGRLVCTARAKPEAAADELDSATVRAMCDKMLLALGNMHAAAELRVDEASSESDIRAAIAVYQEQLGAVNPILDALRAVRFHTKDPPTGSLKGLLLSAAMDDAWDQIWRAWRMNGKITSLLYHVLGRGAAREEDTAFMSLLADECCASYRNAQLVLTCVQRAHADLGPEHTAMPLQQQQKGHQTLAQKTWWRTTPVERQARSARKRQAGNGQRQAKGRGSGSEAGRQHAAVQSGLHSADDGYWTRDREEEIMVTSTVPSGL